MILSNSLSSSTFLRFHDPQQQLNPCSRILQLKNKSRGLGLGLSVVTRAGGATSGSYIFAVVFPFSLLAITIFTAARVADNLDQKFIEELALNETIADGKEDDGSEVTPLEEKPATPRTRNRPKREVEPSSK